ncbi:MAG: hypothetical protein ACD_2C00212G0002 [uncultured bacterium (gcode 4)]|uniref:Uncharacterized protein n=1 Tax=uncultured bacterium (gcode 4) TaxID=1234023 RepID=K2G4D2_9BACT|nr:MAG: hypothetical protein ACD_2C00212G0002 [uncultured bacterium (gcode 4)]
MQNFRSYLSRYINFGQSWFERLSFVKADKLKWIYLEQFQALWDERLQDVVIVIVPDDLWHKWISPSESHAHENMILFRQGYFESVENPDGIAWMIHELAHCQKFLDSENKEDYFSEMRNPAFIDLPWSTYPNNAVERYAFGRQFRFLRRLGKKREEILGLLEPYYSVKDFPFFNKILDEAFENQHLLI